MDLATFGSRLEDVIGRPARVRPFVCDGSPMDCRTFLVGANPATELRSDFWDFWDPNRGFRKADWARHYTAERVSRGKSAVTPTRRVLDRITSRAGVPCLETNVFSTPTASLGELAAADRLTDPFDFLLVALRPRLIVSYGANAREHVEARLSASLQRGTFTPVDAPWGRVEIRAEPHFSRGYSYAAADDLAAEIARREGQGTRKRT